MTDKTGKTNRNVRAVPNVWNGRSVRNDQSGRNGKHCHNDRSALNHRRLLNRLKIWNRSRTIDLPAKIATRHFFSPLDFGDDRVRFGGLLERVEVA